MQKNTKYSYSPLAVPLNSTGRFYNEKKNLLRSPYQRDRDRVIHSTAFRRLKHKTQVFVNTTHDHFRTRITHSLEVSQIARTLGKCFGLNEDLCETLSLAHDLGHTPFGHAGEEVLNDCMSNHGGFDHNLQTIRVVTFLESKYLNFCGLNLTIETIDGLLKHNGPVLKLDKIKSIIGEKYFKNKIKFNKQPSLEAQFASISDDIAYNSHDLEDGLKADLFQIDKLNDIKLINKIFIKYKNKGISNNFLKKIIARDLINIMVLDVIKTTKKNLKKNKIKNIKEIYNSPSKIVDFSNEIKKFDKEIKCFLKSEMYYSKKVKKKTNEGKRIIKTIFKKMLHKPNLYFGKKINDKIDLHRHICDHIAGMTDRYAINLYQGIK